ncbi:MAG: aminotransferase class IV family protein [Methylocystis sp.]|uniref:aminotransferase class IV family protein n=1 Tax=Methylocystis sp. TaxID=1911079 RepID=UPI003DA521A0
MSDQGPIPDRRDDFGLIETLLWTPEGGFHLLEEHLARLATSSAALGFPCDETKVRAALASMVPNAPHPSPAAREREASPRLRVRLVLARSGALETTATPIDPVPPETVWRIVVARARFSSASPLLRHKTTRRALYEDELARAMAETGADEVLFLNERDELCESARCNLFVPRGETLLTPPLACGLLPGTLRASLIAQGRATESILRLPDLPDAFFLGNSVRGLVRARLMA